MHDTYLALLGVGLLERPGGIFEHRVGEIGSGIELQAKS
jgi:hypothetical protein